MSWVDRMALSGLAESSSLSEIMKWAEAGPGLGRISPGIEVINVDGKAIKNEPALPPDISFFAVYNLEQSRLIDRMMHASTQLGDDAVNHYIAKEAETGNPLYRVPGAMAALWTPYTAKQTSLLLGLGSGLGRWSARPFWKYTNEGTRNFSGPWLVRGSAWSPPYGTTFTNARNALQIPQTPTGVVRVDVPPFEFVIGPRPAVKHPEWGEGGGLEFYRGWTFPDE
jgi:hypothetical protein